MKPLLSLIAMLPITALATTPSAPEIINSGGLRIFHRVAAESSGNLCLSPFSIQSALAMVYLGASGETRAQMGRALDWPDSAPSVAATAGAVSDAVMSSASDEVAVNVANRLFGAKGFAFRPPFLEAVKETLHAPLEELDFQKNPPAAAAHIHQWVEKQTRDKIRDLVPADAIDRDTTLVLVNALHLRAPWMDAFQTGATHDADFTIPGKGPQRVPTMRQQSRMQFFDGEHSTAVTLPLRGGFSFIILLPKKPHASADIVLNSQELAQVQNAPARLVSLFLPKFRIAPPSIRLAPVLEGLGMPSAFDKPRGSADFDAMAPRLPDDYLFLSEVLHKSFIAVDESGIEAAAATAAVMARVTSMPAPEEPVELRVNHPFFFALVHQQSGACLFAGRVVDPAK